MAFPVTPRNLRIPPQSVVREGSENYKPLSHADRYLTQSVPELGTPLETLQECRRRLLEGIDAVSPENLPEFKAARVKSIAMSKLGQKRLRTLSGEWLIRKWTHDLKRITPSNVKILRIGLREDLAAVDAMLAAPKKSGRAKRR